MARRGEALYLRGRTWWLDFTHQGIRHAIRLGANISRTTAKELASVTRAAVLKGEAGLGRKKKDCTFDKAKEAFIDWMLANKRPRTQRVYRQALDRLSRSFANKLLSDISAFDLERHKRIRVEAGARVQANRELALLKNVFNRAKAWELYEGENPALGVKMIEEPKRRLRYLEYAEEMKLLSVASPIVQDIIIIGVNTGIRIRAEGLSLRWSDVDFRRGILSVQAAYSKNGQTRNIPLNSRAREVLQRRNAQSRSEFVFTQANGRPYRSIDKPFTKACHDAGLAGTGLSLHSLRHTFASRLVMSGADLRTIQECGGWADLSLVQRYSHLSASHKTTAVERIAGEFHNGNHNSPVSGEVVNLAVRLVSV